MRGTCPWGLGSAGARDSALPGSWRGEGSHPGSFSLFSFWLRKRSCKRNPHPSWSRRIKSRGHFEEVWAGYSQSTERKVVRNVNYPLFSFLFSRRVRTRDAVLCLHSGA